MDIGFSEEQELLRETARKFLDSECDSRFVRERMATAEAVTDGSGGSSPSRAGSASSIPRMTAAAGLALSISLY